MTVTKDQLGKSKLISAIANSIGDMGTLAKASFNQFDKYKFVSIDDFLKATGEVCFNNGLVIVQDETHREVIDKKGKQWLLIDFEFTVYHTSGESLPVLRRSVSVPFTGAQAFGSAQSYALKQFMRSLFQITTGDADDPDLQPTASAKETPTLPPKQITTATEEKLIALADKLTAFPTVEAFKSWVPKVTTGGKTLNNLTEKQGQGLLSYLTKNDDASKWSPKYIKALTDVMNANAKKASEAPY